MAATLESQRRRARYALASDFIFRELMCHIQDFAGLAARCTDDLNRTFKIGLEEKCREGAQAVRSSFLS